MSGFIFALIATVVATAATPKFDREFIELDSGRKLYVEHRAAQKGQPTLVLVNGLTWSTRQWIPLVHALDKINSKIGLVLFDMEGMGQTLLAKAPQREDIPFENQADDLEELMRHLKIKGDVSVAGLSYGGAVAIEHLARYPKRFDNVIAIAPFLERLPDQNKMIQDWIRKHRLSWPLDIRSDDELYDFYLRWLIYSTYYIVEPIILENPFKTEAVYLMVKGAKNWRAEDRVGDLAKGKLHLVAGIEDEYVSDASLKHFWRALPQGVGESFVRVEATKHKVPEERPALTAAWITQILKENPALAKGDTFIADPVKAEARGGGTVIPSRKQDFVKLYCEEYAGLAKQDTLFIHGNLASTRWWEPAVTTWKKEGPIGLGSLILTDWRGCGRNEPWEIDRPFTLRELAEDHLELLRAQGRDEVALVGHSLGGLIALQMMILDPRRFARVVLLDPVGPKGVIFDDGMYEAFRQMSLSRDLTRTVILGTIKGFQSLQPNFQEAIADDAFKAVKGIGSSVLEILKTTDITLGLQELRTPVLILHGAQDGVIPPKDSEDLATRLKNSRLEILPEQGHCWNVEDPTAFVRRLRAWL